MSQAAAQPVVRWRLGARVRRSVLVVHLASAGAWLGIDVVMAPGAAGVGDLIFPPIVSPAALLVATVLAVFEPWGRIRDLTTRR